jgi:hypothetical protein
MQVTRGVEILLEEKMPKTLTEEIPKSRDKNLENFKTRGRKGEAKERKGQDMQREEKKEKRRCQIEMK